jgi:hypothetical protein
MFSVDFHYFTQQSNTQEGAVPRLRGVLILRSKMLLKVMA